MLAFFVTDNGVHIRQAQTDTKNMVSVEQIPIALQCAEDCEDCRKGLNAEYTDLAQNLLRTDLV